MSVIASERNQYFFKVVGGIALAAVLALAAIDWLGSNAGSGNPDLIAKRDLEKGFRIDDPANEFGQFHGGTSPFKLEELRGKTLARPVAKGKVIKPDDVSP